MVSSHDLVFLSSQGWDSWDVTARPLIPERMPVLIDDDLSFEDGPGAPRASTLVNRWLRELPASGCPAQSSWESYARAVKEWAEFVGAHGVGLFDTRERLKLALGRYAEHRATGPVRQRFGPPNRNSILRWIQRNDVTADSGKPLKLNRSRIRTTHLSMRDKSGWAGRRTTIDPNHSPQVEGDNYLSATTPAQRQAVETIVEDAQHDLLRRGQPPIILSEPDTVALARDYPQIVAALRLDGEVIEELVGGRRDVFVAACIDQLSGLHGPKGQPCPARPWVCLLCPLAVFAPRHAVNLLRLKAFFGRQWQQMPAAAFMAVFGPYSQRVDEILARFDPAQLALAAGQVAGRDEELPLRPEESTR